VRSGSPTATARTRSRPLGAPDPAPRAHRVPRGGGGERRPLRHRSRPRPRRPGECWWRSAGWRRSTTSTAGSPGLVRWRRRWRRSSRASPRVHTLGYRISPSRLWSPPGRHVVAPGVSPGSLSGGAPRSAVSLFPSLPEAPRDPDSVFDPAHLPVRQLFPVRGARLVEREPELRRHQTGLDRSGRPRRCSTAAAGTETPLPAVAGAAQSPAARVLATRSGYSSTGRVFIGRPRRPTPGLTSAARLGSPA